MTPLTFEDAERDSHHEPVVVEVDAQMKCTVCGGFAVFDILTMKWSHRG